jgi:hypothetical protein
MAKASDKKGASTQEPPAGPGDEARPGRVEVDGRGRNVWRWAREGIDSTSVLLKGLENDDLALEPTRKVPVVPTTEPASPRGRRPSGDGGAKAAGGKPPPAAKAPARKDKPRAKPERNETHRDRGGGFDPYNSR